MSLRTLVLGTAAISSVHVLRTVAQVLVLPILSRLLTPADYGLVGIAMPLILFVMMLADAGIGMSLVRTPATERGEWSTCFWLSVLLGLMLALGIVGAAPLVARVFAEPSLGPMVRTLAAIVMMQAVFLIPRAAQQQRQEFARIAGTEIAAIAAGIGAALLIALAGGGAWALVGQQLAFFSVRAALTVWWSPFRPLWRLEVQRVKGHLVFGRDVLSNNVVGFVTQSVDNLVIGKALGAAAVGLYAMAFQFARLPMVVLAGPLQYVLYARLASRRDDPGFLREALFALTRLLAVVVFPAVGMVAAAHQAVFTVLLSARWAAAGHLFVLVAPVCAWQALTAIGGTVGMAVGRADVVLRMTVEQGLLRLGALLVAVWFGLEWAALSYSAAALLYSPRLLRLLLGMVGGSLVSYGRAVLVPLLVTLGCVGAFSVLGAVWPVGAWGQLVLGGILAMLAMGASAWVQWDDLRQELACLQEPKPPVPPAGGGSAGAHFPVSGAAHRPKSEDLKSDPARYQLPD